MAKLPKPQIAPVRRPGPPAAPAKPAAAPSAAAPAFGCTLDDAALRRLGARSTASEAGRQRTRKPETWFEGAPASTLDNEVIGYGYGRCAFSDIGDALMTALQPEHRVYLIGWGSDQNVLLNPQTGLTLASWLRQSRAQIRALLFDGRIRAMGGIYIGQRQNEFLAALINAAPNGAAVEDDHLPGQGIHHQKMLVVQGHFGLVAFLGGMDLVPSRTTPGAGGAEPWHDVHLRIVGPAARDCRKVFEDRWIDHPATPRLDTKFGLRETAADAERRAVAFPEPAAIDRVALASTSYEIGSSREQRRQRVAIGRTFGRFGPGETPFAFAPQGEYSALRLVQNGIEKARWWIYLEDQYMCSSIMLELLARKLREPDFRYLLLLISGAPSVSMDFRNIATVHNTWRRTFSSIDPGRKKWGMYYLKPTSDPERQKWCGTFVHSKTWIFDDDYVVCGSANCDNRGFTLDSEVVAGVAEAFWTNVPLGQSFATDLRVSLWHKHLGVPHAQLRDWDTGLRYWRQPPASAMVTDATAPEVDYDLAPPTAMPSPSEARNIELLYQRVFDPDARSRP